MDPVAHLADIVLTAGAPVASRAVVAIAGSVAAGKSTLAAALCAALADRGATGTVVSTDGFLRTNADLDADGLLLRKGYPESYDETAIERFFDGIDAGRARVTTPRYSHLVFDIDGSETHELADVVIVEGVNALQHPIAERCLVRFYLDVAEPIVRAWFVARMLGLIDRAEHDPTSFYARFVSFDPARRREFAVSVWEQINLPNLEQHIAPSHDNATHTVRLDAGHAITDVIPRPPRPLTRGTS